MFNAGAIVGLALIAYGSYLGFGPGLGFGIIGGLIGLSVVPGVVLSCLVVADRLRQAQVRRVLVGVVLTVSIAAALAAMPLVVTVFSELTPNPAANRLRPLVDQLEADGGRRICDFGDPGLGPDNTSPSKGYYYRVPVRPALRQGLQATARRVGLRDQPFPGPHLAIDVDTGPTLLGCSSGLHGPTYTPPGGYALVLIRLDLPAR